MEKLSSPGPIQLVEQGVHELQNTMSPGELDDDFIVIGSERPLLQDEYGMILTSSASPARMRWYSVSVLD